MKKLLFVLTLIFVFCLSMFAVGCVGGNDSGSNEPKDERDEQIVAVYNLYVANAQSNGQVPLTYEEWFASIKGEKGDKGDKGDTGATGATGKSAYEIWLDNGYTGTEEDFLNWLRVEDDLDVNVGVIYDISIDGTYAEVIGYDSTAKRVVIANEYKGLPVKSIYEKAFYDDDNITVVYIPDSVESIGVSAFYGCSSLTRVVIGNGVTSIGNDAFYGCSKLLRVTMGNSVTSIGSYAFYNCSSLSEITIPASVTSIGSWAFHNCNGITKVNYTGTIDGWAQIKFADSYANPTYYAKNLYINGQLVTTANITTATKISDYAFYYCSRLTNVTISNSVTSIGNSAFYDCNSLTNVTIPNSVTGIGVSAFSDCDSLTSITFEDSANWYRIKSNNTNSYNDWQNKQNGTLIDLSNPTTNATDFTSSSLYYNYYWYKK